MTARTVPADANELAQQSRLASLDLQSATLAQKSAALHRIHALLAERKDQILEANKKDLEIAQKDVESGKISSALYKRLDLSTGDKYSVLLQGVLDVDKLDDPTGQVSLATRLDTGLDLYRVSCPVGVLLIIFEARPEVVVQISCLALKSGNAVILKGGKEASHSNQALFQVIKEALASLPAGGSQIPPTAVQLVSSRDEIATLLALDKYIDLVIPRGSKQLVQYVQGATRIPVLGHADGLCSLYLDASADVSKAIPIVVDSKCSYPAACNAAETLLIHKDALPIFRDIAAALGKNGVQLHCDPRSLAALGDADVACSEANPEADYDNEFLDLVLAVKTVDSLEDAISHINAHGSHHTDVIVTEDKEHADLFMRKVDAAGVYWNASSRFADGFRYGFGAEIGVSTNKTHARGPVGLEGLVIYKYRLYGSGHASADYGDGKKPYLHHPIAPDSAPHRFIN
ncbi:glutamate-5-semialdehyde dehydrogenase [Powellomyces hirtus]|uniref:glutamate-5-semialdehyde dehydrogenase n=1 Tax=Powellomyces hirtus TaxID=109895 RepID=A0A507EGJ7_9FUNG|nr:glutamate-5-semialdehyde dehydrogenase [Powellomyces hirtus]